MAVPKQRERVRGKGSTAGGIHHCYERENAVEWKNIEKEHHSEMPKI